MRCVGRAVTESSPVDHDDQGEAPAILSRLASADLLAAAPDACMVIDADGHICAANGLGADMFGTPLDELIGKPIETLVPDRLREGHVRHRERFIDDPHTRAMGSGLTLSARRGDGTTFPVEVSLSPLTLTLDDGTAERFVIAAIRDVTEQTRIRERLAAANRAAALAEDRERLARDLHDTVIQEIFGVGLGLQSIVGRIDDPTAAARVSSVIDDLDRVIRQIRTAIFGLTSHRDWGRGVRGEILRVAAEQRSVLGFEPTVVFDGDIDAVAGTVVEQMLPVLKECLSNVATHAEADRCDVVVEATETLVTLSVIDDGRGPGGRPDDPLEPRDGPGRGHGLRNLTRRAELLGGTFEFGPAEFAGSRATWSVPTDHNRDEGAET